MKNYCCESMEFHLKYKCDQHDNPFDCPDNLIYYSNKFDEFGIIIHNGGTSYLAIQFCPWCGKKLPESKRDLWSDTLRKLGYDDPLDQDIPEEYKTDKWYNK